MNIRQVVTGLVVLIGLGIAFAIGRYLLPPRTGCPNNTRCITVSAGTSAGTCEVDYPVALMHYNEFVQWLSSDHKYSVTFLNVTPPPTSPPLPAGYTPESPLAPPQEPVYFDSSTPSNKFNVKHKDKYYYYAIFDQNYPSNPCKVSTDAQDTGLHVKP